MDFSVVIPARYGSTRLPGKPLRKIGNHPLIWHVYKRAEESGANEIIVATDDQRIRSIVEDFGGRALMTAPEHRSGTERLVEIVDICQYPDDKILVNLQGDEPDTPPELISQVAGDLRDHEHADLSTACTAIESAAELFDPHVVKLIRDRNNYALYFSRAPIPWDRDAFSITRDHLPHLRRHFRHVGIYAYRAGFLHQYAQWSVCELEQMESLEQLRVLWNGGRIYVAEAIKVPGHGIDTESDLKRANRLVGRATGRRSG